MPTFPSVSLNHPGRAPTPPELCHCLAQLLPHFAALEAVDLLPMVVPLLAVLRMWNIQLRSAARLALEVVPEEDIQLRRRLKALGRQKAQDALETKLHGFGVMVGLWRIQSAILAGTTAKAELQPLIDEYFPPAPLPNYFLACDIFPLSPTRRQEIEATILRTRRTCQTLRKRAAHVAAAYTGPAEGLRAALLAAKISDGPIGLEPADFEGDDGTARAVLSQAESIRSLWDELTGMFPAPTPSSPPAPSAPVPHPSPIICPPTSVVTSSQETIVEDSQKSPPAYRPPSTHTSPAIRPPSPPTVSLPSRPAAAAAAATPKVASPAESASRSAAAPAPTSSARLAPASARPKVRPPFSDGDDDYPVEPLRGSLTNTANEVAPPPSTAPAAPPPGRRAPDVAQEPRPRHLVTQLISTGGPGRALVSTRPLQNRWPSSSSANNGLFDPPARAPTSRVALPRPATNPLKRALNRTSGRGVFDSSSDDDDNEMLLPLRKQARTRPSKDGSPLLSAANSAASLAGSQGTDTSSLGYVDLPPGTVPRPRLATPPPLLSGAAAAGVGAGSSRDYSGQARGKLRRT